MGRPNLAHSSHSSALATASWTATHVRARLPVPPRPLQVATSVLPSPATTSLQWRSLATTYSPHASPVTTLSSPRRISAVSRQVRTGRAPGKHVQNGLVKTTASGAKITARSLDPGLPFAPPNTVCIDAGDSDDAYMSSCDSSDRDDNQSHSSHGSDDGDVGSTDYEEDFSNTHSSQRARSAPSSQLYYDSSSPERNYRVNFAFRHRHGVAGLSASFQRGFFRPRFRMSGNWGRVSRFRCPPTLLTYFQLLVLPVPDL